MSKLLDQFQMLLTDKVRAQRVKPTIKNFSVDTFSQEGHQSFAKEVKVSAKFDYIGWIDHDVKGTDAEKMADFVHSVKRSVAEDVFGEFRPLIIEMRNSIYDENTTRLRTLLAELETRMFTVV
jgi:uncharacterized protein (DUF1810 family)